MQASGEGRVAASAAWSMRNQRLRTPKSAPAFAPLAVPLADFKFPIADCKFQIASCGSDRAECLVLASSVEDDGLTCEDYALRGESQGADAGGLDPP